MFDTMVKNEVPVLQFKSNPLLWSGIGYYELQDGEWHLVSQSRPDKLSWFENGRREYISRLKVMNFTLAPLAIRVAERSPQVQKIHTGTRKGRSFVAYVPDGNYAPQVIRCKRSKPSPDKIRAMQLG